jgi:hypothetical protein
MAALSPAVALDGQLCVLRSASALASPDDLRAHIEDRLTVIAAEELAPWCNLGTVHVLPSSACWPRRVGRRNQYSGRSTRSPPSPRDLSVENRATGSP